MNKQQRDSASKRSVPTPKVQSLHENMGLGDPNRGSYGTPHPPKDYVFDNIKNSGSRGGGAKKNGMAPKGRENYDAGTRVKMSGAKGAAKKKK